jgi:alpha-beta hydrolase superfamily lysophospholipase
MTRPRARPSILANAIAACLALAACSGQAPRADIGPSRAAVSVPDLDALALARWPSEGRTRAVILALHGFGDAGPLTFGDAATYWQSRGITVYAPDQRGFGANASRKRWPGAETLVADAIAHSKRLRAAHPGVPLVVVGHSMGGGVALAAAARGLEADALVLAGPAIAGGPALSPVARASARALAAIAPDRRWTGRGLVDIQPTDNREALIRTASDPRHFGDPSSREILGLVQIMDAAAAAAPEVTIPTLTLMGTNDEVLRPARVRAVHNTIPGAEGFRLYPDGWHWLFRDLQAPLVWSEVADFALSSSPTAAAQENGPG